MKPVNGHSAMNMNLRTVFKMSYCKSIPSSRLNQLKELVERVTSYVKDVLSLRNNNRVRSLNSVLEVSLFLFLEKQLLIRIIKSYLDHKTGQKLHVIEGIRRQIREKLKNL